MMNDLLLVMVGGAAGSALRFLVALATQPWSALPVGTIIVNVVGSFILGTLAGATTLLPVSRHVLLLVGTGLCGGFTTYSTLALDVVTMWQHGRHGDVVLYLGVSMVGGLLAMIGGMAVGRLLR